MFWRVRARSWQTGWTYSYCLVFVLPDHSLTYLVRLGGGERGNRGAMPVDLLSLMRLDPGFWSRPEALFPLRAAGLAASSQSKAWQEIARQPLPTNGALPAPPLSQHTSPPTEIAWCEDALVQMSERWAELLHSYACVVKRRIEWMASFG